MQLRSLLLVVMALAFTNIAMSASYSWVYTSGIYSWPGDFSYGATADYWDQSGGPMNGAYDIKVNVNKQWGGWQPYAPNVSFKTDGYGYFTVALKPTRANQTWQVYFTKVHSMTAKAVNIASYGAAPRVGVWTTYTIPLSAFGITNATIGTFCIQDTTGLASNTWYVDNAGFDSSSGASKTTTTSSSTSSSSSSSSSTSSGSSTTTSGTTTSGATSAAASSTIYYDGTFNWPGSFSYDVTLDYMDTTGAPPSGAYDIRVQLTGKWGAWQPYALNFSYNSAPYTKLVFALEPTIANQVWQLYFMKIHDVPTGKVLNMADYGPAPVAGKWNYYSIPLADAGVLGTSIYKFAIQDETGLASNTWYVDSVGFE